MGLLVESLSVLHHPTGSYRLLDAGEETVAGLEDPFDHRRDPVLELWCKSWMVSALRPGLGEGRVEGIGEEADLATEAHHVGSARGV